MHNIMLYGVYCELRLGKYEKKIDRLYRVYYKFIMQEDVIKSFLFFARPFRFISLRLVWIIIIIMIQIIIVIIYKRSDSKTITIT